MYPTAGAFRCLDSRLLQADARLKLLINMPLPVNLRGFSTLYGRAILLSITINFLGPYPRCIVQVTGHDENRICEEKYDQVWCLYFAHSVPYLSHTVVCIGLLYFFNH